MAFVRKRRIESTERFWASLEQDTSGAPAAVCRLAEGENEFACDEHEANEALDWAAQHPDWTEAPAPLFVTGD